MIDAGSLQDDVRRRHRHTRPRPGDRASEEAGGGATCSSRISTGTISRASRSSPPPSTLDDSICAMLQPQPGASATSSGARCRQPYFPVGHRRDAARRKESVHSGGEGVTDRQRRRPGTAPMSHPGGCCSYRGPGGRQEGHLLDRHGARSRGLRAGPRRTTAYFQGCRRADHRRPVHPRRGHREAVLGPLVLQPGGRLRRVSWRIKRLVLFHHEPSYGDQKIRLDTRSRRRGTSSDIEERGVEVDTGQGRHARLTFDDTVLRHRRLCVLDGSRGRRALRRAVRATRRASIRNQRRALENSGSASTRACRSRTLEGLAGLPMAARLRGGPVGVDHRRCIHDELEPSLQAPQGGAIPSVLLLLVRGLAIVVARPVAPGSPPWTRPARLAVPGPRRPARRAGRVRAPQSPRQAWPGDGMIRSELAVPGLLHEGQGLEQSSLKAGDYRVEAGHGLERTSST
ncbi:MAG: hypothetical protein MZU95_08455 [Desulfomicrobium escambiense]|nr:hypothetical protein [Desulfomicrobium escambiense]